MAILSFPRLVTRFIHNGRRSISLELREHYPAIALNGQLLSLTTYHGLVKRIQGPEQFGPGKSAAKAGFCPSGAGERKTLDEDFSRLGEREFIEIARTSSPPSGKMFLVTYREHAPLDFRPVYSNERFVVYALPPGESDVPIPGGIQ